MFCSICGKEKNNLIKGDDYSYICSDCHSLKAKSSSNNTIKSARHYPTSAMFPFKDYKKYGLLYAYSIILQIIGWIFIVIGFSIIVWALFKLSDKHLAEPFMLGVVSLLMYGFGVIFAGIVSIAGGQLICVWRDIEENTRKITSLLENSKIS